MPPAELLIATAPPLSPVPFTTITPVPPVPALVWMVISVPPFKAALICVSPMLELLAGSNSPLLSVLALPCTMVTSVGSSSQCPFWPRVADALIRAPDTSRACLPEVSIIPPLPPCSPPLAVMLPYARVVFSAQIITFPPSPFAVASAVMEVCGPTYVNVAFRTSGFLPWKSPPTRMVPPPVEPLALRLPDPVTPTSLPSILMLPPLPVLLDASSKPLLSVREPSR